VESDETLYRKTKRGDLSAFDELYARYRRPLFGFLAKMLGRREDAEDVLHETMLRVVRTREVDLAAEGTFRAWVFRIARNAALNVVRAERYDEVKRDAAPPPPAALPADELLEGARMEQALERAVAALPAALAELYHLRASGLTLEEMARVVDVPLGTMKSRVRLLVERLRKELSPWIASE
jgi:RNA polymerase sigma-70 factor (ECF subfamily)